MLRRSLFMFTTLAFFLILTGALVFFFRQMEGHVYYVNDGLRHLLAYKNRLGHDHALQGLIYSLTFFLATGILFFLAMLPGRDVLLQVPQAPAPPPGPAQPPREDGFRQTLGSLPGKPQEGARADEKSEVEKMEEDLSREEAPDIILTQDELTDTTQSEVIYGTQAITEDSMWSFVHSYPDSAVRFLFRKNLNNKALSAAEEEIYKAWELRGMNRKAMRDCILQIMGWPKIPDSTPAFIWMELRDRIFELRAQG